MKKFLTDTLFITGGGMISRMKGIVFIPFIISLVGLDNYGAFVQLLLNATFFKVFFSLELGMGFQRFASKIENEQRHELGRHFYTVLTSTLLLGGLGVLVMFGASWYMNQAFFEGKHLGSLQVASLIMLSSSLHSNFSKFLLCRKRFKLFSVVTTAYDLIPYLGFVAGIFLYQDVFWGMVFYTVTDYLVVLANLAYQIREVAFARPSVALFKEYTAYTYPLVFSAFEGGLLSKVDRYFVSYYLGTEAVGVYNILYSVCNLLEFITLPIRRQVMSYLPKVWDQGYHKEAIAMIRATLLAFLAIAIGGAALLTFYFEGLLAMLSSKQAGIPYLEWNVALVSLGIIASATKQFYYLPIKLKKQTSQEMWYQLAGVVPNIILNILLIPRLGILGASISTFASYAIIVTILNHYHSLAIDRKFVMHLFSFFGLAAVIGLVEYFIPQNQEHLLISIMSIGVAVAAYSSMIFFTKKAVLADTLNSVKHFRKLSYSKQK